MSRGQRRGRDVVDDVKDTPSTLAQLEDLPPDSALRIKLTEFISNPANASLDVTNRMVIGTQVAGGAHSDVFYGKISTSNIDELAIRPILHDDEQLRRHLRQNPICFKKVAIKRQRLSRSLKDDGARSLSRELRVWAGLDQPNILRLLGFTLVGKLPSFISDWMDNGTLTNYTAKNPNFSVRSMILQIASGLVYLHKKGVVHSDLKPDNILVSHDGRPLLSDFGISRIVIESNTVTGTTTLGGNVRYMAPELLGPQAAGLVHQFHTKQSDVWAFGMVVYVMNEITSDRIPSRPVSSTRKYFEEMWDMCMQCWKMNPRHRPKCSELVNTLREAPFSDLAKVPVEFKKEGDDWLAVYNQEMPGTLDIELMHTLYHDRCRFSVRGICSAVYCVRFSPDGQYIATGCFRTARIFNAITGAKICVFNDPGTIVEEGARIRCVCFSPDGKYLAVSGSYGFMQIWDIAGRSIHRVLEGHNGTVYSLDFSRDGRFIASGSHDTTTRIWDMESDNALVLSPTIPPGVYAYVYSVAISPDMKLVAAGCSDGVVRIWDAGTGHLVEQLEGHTGCARSVAFTPDDKGLISGSLDRTMKRWDLTGFLCNPDRDQPLSATIHSDPPFSSSSSNSSTLLPPESANSGTAVLAEPASTDGHGNRGSVCSLDFVGHKIYVRSVAVSPDGQWVVSGSRDRDVRIWNSSTAEAVVTLRGHRSDLTFVDLNPAGDVLATGSYDRTVRLWRLTKLQE